MMRADRFAPWVLVALLASCASAPAGAPVLSPVQRLNAEGLRRFERGESDSAGEAYHAALREAETVDDRAGQAESWNNLGALSFARGELDEALMMHLAALRLYERCSPRLVGEVRARSNLGMVLHAMGRNAEARTQFDAAAKLSEHLGQAGPALLARAGMAAVQSKEGNAAAARAMAEKVAQQAHAAGDKDAEAAALAVLGDALQALGDRQGARARLEEALALDRERRMPFAIAEDLRALSRVASAAGRRAEAADYLLRCARVSRALGQLELAEQELSQAAQLLVESTEPDKVIVNQELEAVRRARAQQPAAAGRR
jgi:tetratricopeptide (TPR) repeat protein